MAAVYRIMIVSGVDGTAASEVYYTPSTSPQNAALLCQNLLAAKAATMNTNQFIQGVRASIFGKKRSSGLMLPVGGVFADSGQFISIPAQGTISTTTSAGTDTEWRSVLQMQFKYGNGQTANRYLSGIPQGIVGAEPATLDMAAVPGYQAAWSKFAQFLTTSNFQILTQDTQNTALIARPIGLISQTATPFDLGIIVLTATAPSFTQGAKVAVQGFRPAKGTRAATLNGTWYVDSLDTTSQTGNTIVYLRGSSNIIAAAQRFTDKSIIRLVSYIPQTITNIIAYKAGIHKRGKPPLTPRGRRLTRPTLDP